MQVKILEIRDEGTHIPILAVKMLADNETQAWYVHGRCGYPRDGTSIAITPLGGERNFSCDPYHWAGNRTLAYAHNYIIDHWDELSDGDVVDAEFAAGQRTEPRTSERFNEVIR